MNAKELRILYTNWQGQTAERRIVPDRIWFGSTEYHPEPQWLIDAFDADKQAPRTFALQDMRRIGPPTALPEADANTGEALFSLPVDDHLKARLERSAEAFKLLGANRDPFEMAMMREVWLRQYYERKTEALESELAKLREAPS